MSINSSPSLLPSFFLSILPSFSPLLFPSLPSLPTLPLLPAPLLLAPYLFMTTPAIRSLILLLRNIKEICLSEVANLVVALVATVVPRYFATVDCLGCGISQWHIGRPVRLGHIGAIV